MTNCVIFTGRCSAPLDAEINAKVYCSPEIANVPVYSYFCPTGGGWRAQVVAGARAGESRLVSCEDGAATVP